MARIGVVETVAGEEAVIDTTRQGPCGTCHHGGACSMHLGGAGQGHERLRADNPVGARPGDVVEFDLLGHTELKLALLVWMWPLLGLIVGAVAGAWLGPRVQLDADAATLLGAGLGFGFSFVALRGLDRRMHDDRRLRPEILRVVTASSCAQSAAAE